MKADDFLGTDETQLRKALQNGSYEMFSPLEDEGRLLDEAHRLTDMQAEFLLVVYYSRNTDVPARLLGTLLSSQSLHQREHALNVLAHAKQVPVDLYDAVRRIRESPTTVVEEGLAKAALRRFHGPEDSATRDHED